MKKMSRAHRNGAMENNRREPGGAASPARYTVLVLFWCVILSIGAAVIYLLIRPQISAWHPVLAWAAFLAIAIPAAACTLFFVLQALSFLVGRDLVAFIPFAWRRALVMALFPLCRALGGILGQSREEVSASCIAFNNRIARWGKGMREGGGLLVLLPRCLQHSGCTQQLIESITNCQRCGRCVIDHLVGLMESYTFTMSVVTGGEMARKIIGDIVPSRIIAVACESELVKGLQEISRIPIAAIPNRRPKGPCKDTVIDLGEFEQVLRSFASPRHRDR